MLNAEVFDVPVELDLELVPVVGADSGDAKRKLLDDVVDEIKAFDQRQLEVWSMLTHVRILLSIATVWVVDNRFVGPITPAQGTLRASRHARTRRCSVLS